MKYTHPDIVNSIKARKDGKDGKDTLSWIENFCIYLSESSCKPRKEEKIENVLVLSIENEKRLSIYDCFFKIQPKRTRFCVNKAIPNVCFSKLKALLEEVKWDSKETREYWNDVLVKKEETGYNLAKVDESVLQREQTKASCCCPDLSMIEFLSNLGNEIEFILQRLGGIKSYHKVYIANGYGNKSYYPLVAPLQYALYKRFKTDSVEPFVKPELFMKQPLASYDWKKHKARFYTGTLSRAIGLNTSVEVSLNDLMNAGGVVVTFPLDENNGCYTMPATPVFKECSSDRKKCEDTKTLSLGDVTLTWADLYGQVQWDYKVGELAFKQVKLSIYADGCQRLYLMDGDKVLTVITSNGSTVEVENCLKVSNAEPATTIDKPEPIEEPLVTDLLDTVHVPTTPIKDKPEISIELKREVSQQIGWGIDKVLESIRRTTNEFLQSKYGADWEKNKNEIFVTTGLKDIDYGNYHKFLKEYAEDLQKYWGQDNYFDIKRNMKTLRPYRNLKSHKLDELIKKGKMEVMSLFQNMKNIATALNDSETITEVENCYKNLDNVWKI